MSSNNVAASIRARLLNIAKSQGVDFQQVLVRFALERILYRLSQSQHSDRFFAERCAAIYPLVRPATPFNARCRSAWLWLQ